MACDRGLCGTQLALKGATCKNICSVIRGGGGQGVLKYPPLLRLISFFIVIISVYFYYFSGGVRGYIKYL